MLVSGEFSTLLKNLNWNLHYYDTIQLKISRYLVQLNIFPVDVPNQWPWRLTDCCACCQVKLIHTSYVKGLYVTNWKATCLFRMNLWMKFESSLDPKLPTLLYRHPQVVNLIFCKLTISAWPPSHILYFRLYHWVHVFLFHKRYDLFVSDCKTLRRYVLPSHSVTGKVKYVSIVKVCVNYAYFRDHGNHMKK